MNNFILVRFPNGKPNASHPVVMSAGEEADAAAALVRAYRAGGAAGPGLYDGKCYLAPLDITQMKRFSINTAELRDAKYEGIRAKHTTVEEIEGKLARVIKEVEAREAIPRETAALVEELSSLEAARNKAVSEATVTNKPAMEAGREIAEIDNAMAVVRERQKLNARKAEAAKGEQSDIINILRDLNFVVVVAMLDMCEVQHLERAEKVLAAVREWNPDITADDFAVIQLTGYRGRTRTPEAWEHRGMPWPLNFSDTRMVPQLIEHAREVIGKMKAAPPAEPAAPAAPVPPVAGGREYVLGAAAGAKGATAKKVTGASGTPSPFVVPSKP